MVFIRFGKKSVKNCLIFWNLKKITYGMNVMRHKIIFMCSVIINFIAIVTKLKYKVTMRKVKVKLILNGKKVVAIIGKERVNMHPNTHFVS